MLSVCAETGWLRIVQGYRRDRTGIPQDAHAIPFTQTQTQTKTQTKLYRGTKLSFGEFKNVKLTKEEHDRLKTSYGNRIDAAIEVLDTYIESKGKRYKSHYAVMKKGGWVWKETKPEGDGFVSRFE